MIKRWNCPIHIGKDCVLSKIPNKFYENHFKKQPLSTHDFQRTVRSAANKPTVTSVKTLSSDPLKQQRLQHHLVQNGANHNSLTFLSCRFSHLPPKP